MGSEATLAAEVIPVGFDPWPAAEALDDRMLVEEIVALGEEISRLQAVLASRVSEADRRGLPVADGFGSTTGWLMSLSGDPAEVCRSRVRTARGLRHMPHTRRAFCDGRLSEPRVRALVEARDTEPGAFARDEAVLVAQAHNLDASDFRHALAHWRRLADHEGHLRDADRAYRKRALHASTTWGGIVRIDGQLDSEGGATLLAALRSITDPQNLDPTDRRTPAQRRADALVEICRRHLDSSDRPTVGGEKPHLVVHLDLDTLEGRAGRHCDLDHAGVITPSAARRLACDAKVTRVIAGPDSQPLDIGRATRVIPPGLRRALVARDRHCTHPGCDTPAAWCDAHHRHHWADGGPTSLGNLQLLCRRHHRHAHQRE
ncbi:MAG: HNH endonuclease [Actinobacteria bacterium]|nr:HNH endonuclease [Actinomycetota bacterium]